MCSKQSQLTDCGNAMKREQKLVIGTIDYSEWCEVTPLIVISCRGPSSLCCFHSGRSSAGSQCSQPNPSHQHSGSRRWKVALLAGAKRGPALLHVFPAFNSLFICLSHWPQKSGKGAFIKILLFNGLFSAREQEAAEPSVLLSDLRWVSASMLWSLIMESTVVFIFSGKRKRLSLPLFFLSLSQLKSGTMPPLCVREDEDKTFPARHLCEIF